MARMAEARCDVAIATHADLPDGTTDDRLLAGALMAGDARVRFAVWDDPAVDWSAAARTVIRSTWDYHLRPDAWFTWLDATATRTRLVNSAAVLRWNSSKRYLLDLEAAGVPIVPTVHVTRGTAIALAARLDERGWRDVVVKPAIGASASGAERFADANLTDAQAHLDALLAAGDALIQPYQRAVEDARERSLVFIDGAFSHAFTKPPFLRGVGDGLGESPHEAGGAEVAIARRALEVSPAPVSYARVDLVPTPDGPRLMELELIEPDLGLRLHAAAADRLAAAVLAA
jgi:glutathione synthase/RimK-type ligase-like ATP-grasp enzyme